MRYYIKIDQDPTFTMSDGTRMVVPKSTMKFRIGPEIPDDQYFGVMYEVIKRGILEKIEEMNPIAPNAQHCLIIGSTYFFENEEGTNAVDGTLNLGIALTEHEPKANPSLYHTEKVSLAIRMILIHLTGTSPEN